MSEPHPKEPGATAYGRDPLDPNSARPESPPQQSQPHPGQPQPGQPQPVQPYGGIPAYGAAGSGGASTVARLGSGAAGLLLGGLLFPAISLMSAAASTRVQTFDFSATTTLPLAGFTLLTVALVVGLAVTARFSSAGLYVAGAMHFLVALLFAFAPRLSFDLLYAFYSMSGGRGLDYYLMSGTPIVTGTVFIVTGVIISGLRRKALSAASTPASLR